MKKLRDVTRINFNISNELLDKVDNYASINGINRTSALSCILSTYFRQNEAMDSLTELSKLVSLTKSQKRPKTAKKG